MRVLEYEGMSMMSIYLSEEKRLTVSGIKEKEEREMLLRRFLFSHKYHYRLNVKALPGKKDIVISKHQTVIFINDCFWFGHETCDYFVLPKTRTEWWKNRIADNKEWDQKYIEKLLKQGWKVANIWECDLAPEKREHTLHGLLHFLENDQQTGLYTISGIRQLVAYQDKNYKPKE